MMTKERYAELIGEPICEKSENGLEWKFYNSVDRLPTGTKLYTGDMVRAILDKALAGGWISVKDRLPNLHQKVLVFHENEDGDRLISTAHFNTKPKNSFLGVGKYICKKVTYWMPLPAAPKPEGEE